MVLGTAALSAPLSENCGPSDASPSLSSVGSLDSHFSDPGDLQGDNLGFVPGMHYLRDEATVRQIIHEEGPVTNSLGNGAFSDVDTSSVTYMGHSEGSSLLSALDSQERSICSEYSRCSTASDPQARGDLSRDCCREQEVSPATRGHTRIVTVSATRD